MGTLANVAIASHSLATCGQSRGRGLVTSDSTRRSRFLGRVAVTHVQGSPKGGGALCVRRVTSTRLAPVPPSKEATVSMLNNLPKSRFMLGAILAAVLIPYTSTANAQGKPTGRQQQANQELLDRIGSDIRLAPDRACTYTQPEIERYLQQAVNQFGLMDTISQTVFGRASGASADAAPSGYAALMARMRNETAQRYANAQAVYRAQETGGEVPVGDRAPMQVPTYDSYLQEIRATTRTNGGLECTGNVRVGDLRFPVTYSFYVNPNDADGWSSEWIALPRFDEASALDPASTIRIAYGDALLTLDEAQFQAASDAVDQAEAEVAAAAQAIAEDDYANSPAGRAAAERQRQEAIGRQRACEQNGGTWGVDFAGMIVRVDARELNGNAGGLLEPGCYFLRP